MNARAVSVVALLVVVAVALFWMSRRSEPNSIPTSPTPKSAQPAVDPRTLPYFFSDITESSGLAAFTQVNGTPEKRWVVDSFGAGVALFDANNDGELDAYLSNGSMLEGVVPGKEPRDALFLNDGGARFHDATAAAGLGDAHWTCGVRTVDLDGDGDVEMYLTNYGPDVLYDNLGGARFADVTAQAGLGDPRWSTGAAFLDFDHDGDLDLFVANYLEFDEPRMLKERPRGTMHGHSQTLKSGQELADVTVMKGPMGLDPAPSIFYLNEDGRFRDASVEVGIDKLTRFGFQVLTFDPDLDGWLDVLVVNDVVEDSLWHNEQGKRFKEAALNLGMAVRQDGVPQGGMGGALGDYDGDGVIDLWVSNYVEDYSTLFRGKKGGFFDDVTNKVGLRRDTWSMVGWGCGLVDFDSDGDVELFEINGHVYPQVDLLDLGTSYKQSNQLWEWRDGRYVTPAGGGGAAFTLPRAGRSSALGDVDSDGDVDLLVGNLDAPPTLLRNDSRNGHWLKVLVVGSGKNRDAIGARLLLSVGAKRHLRLIGTGGGFLGSNEPREHFGLGTATQAETLEVTWPDGRKESFGPLDADKLYTIQDAGRGGQARVGESPIGRR
ncbi:MAG: CRTAC1 family protein [Planctomycetes bacterium]|nr:CRTAC1 family protein [Planctomycetota bacterium]